MLPLQSDCIGLSHRRRDKSDMVLGEQRNVETHIFNSKCVFCRKSDANSWLLVICKATCAISIYLIKSVPMCKSSMIPHLAFPCKPHYSAPLGRKSSMPSSLEL